MTMLALRIPHSCSRGYHPTTRLRPFYHSTTRMVDAKTKSDSEWRAILTPEQVCTSAVVWDTDLNPNSSEFYVRKGQSRQELVNTRTTVGRASTPALAVRHHCTRATPSSRAVVDGLPSLMVMFAVHPLWSVAYRRSQPFLVL
jgi:hypothetical protein